jgi:hypothetical protein
VSKRRTAKTPFVLTALHQFALSALLAQNSLEDFTSLVLGMSYDRFNGERLSSLTANQKSPAGDRIAAFSSASHPKRIGCQIPYTAAKNENQCSICTKNLKLQASGDIIRAS